VFCVRHVEGRDDLSGWEFFFFRLNLWYTRIGTGDIIGEVCEVCACAFRPSIHSAILVISIRDVHPLFFPSPTFVVSRQARASSEERIVNPQMHHRHITPLYSFYFRPMDPQFSLSFALTRSLARVRTSDRPCFAWVSHVSCSAYTSKII
jgi:hypothetical protein